MHATENNPCFTAITFGRLHSKDDQGCSESKPGAPPEFEPAKILPLHERVLEGDADAREEVGRLFLSWLERKLCIPEPHLDPTWYCDAASDAIMTYLQNPAKFNPAKRDRLDLFLRGIAINKLASRNRDEGRRRNREGKTIEELSQNDCGSACEEIQVAAKRLRIAKRICWAVVKRLPDPRDCQCFRLWSRQRLTAQVFAHLDGIAQLPPGEQIKKLAQLKDRFRHLVRREAAKARAPGQG